MQSEFIKASVKLVDEIQTCLQQFLTEYTREKVFVLMDKNTKKYCYPIIQQCFSNSKVHKICIEGGEAGKNIETVSNIWEMLIENNAAKKSLLINLGGGIVTDIGGFVASTFKRGMDFINIPTSLMAQIDAAIGGKNGINYSGYKNQIGVINQPKEVLIFPDFLKTLDNENILSGFAEIIKYRYISSNIKQDELFGINPLQVDIKEFETVIKNAIDVKTEIVSTDPEEKNIRKALNFGHTFGHAFEALYAKKNLQLLHGHAVAAGLICELYLSVISLNYPLQKLNELINYLIPVYGKLNITLSDYDLIINAMKQDKKNRGNDINFTLIDEDQKVCINQRCTAEKIHQAFNFYVNL